MTGLEKHASSRGTYHINACLVYFRRVLVIIGLPGLSYANTPEGNTIYVAQIM